jgi:hypothetical protein
MGVQILSGTTPKSVRPQRLWHENCVKLDSFGGQNLRICGISCPNDASGVSFEGCPAVADWAVRKKERGIMKQAILASAFAVAATGAFAGGMETPVMEPDVIQFETSSSSGGIIVPLLLLLVIAAAASSN